MLVSIAIILLCAIILGSIFSKIKLPAILAMLLIGIVLGPFVLDIIDGKILSISEELRQLALIIILTRAGLSLDIKELKSVGKSAVLMSFLPATFEIIGYVVFATLLLNLSIANSLLIGSVMAAVSPAVVVPRMLKIKQEGYGVNKKIPQIITAASSVDDVYVLILFSSFLVLSGGAGFSFNILWQIPASIVFGIIVGIIVGFLLVKLFKKVHMRDTLKVLLMLSFAFLLVGLETLIKGIVPYSALLSVVTIGIMLSSFDKVRADKLASKYSKLWVFAEILLFVLVGASVDVSYAVSNGAMIIAVIALALVFRCCAVMLALIGSKLDIKEKLFCMIAYLPKATVQAAIGGVALAMGLIIGQTVLSFAVVGILFTAPLGAILIDFTYKKLLKKDDNKPIKNIDI